MTEPFDTSFRLLPSLTTNFEVVGDTSSLIGENSSSCYWYGLGEGEERSVIPDTGSSTS